MLVLRSPADVSMAAARSRLSRPERPAPVLPALCAAALLAMAAVGLAGAVILGPSGRLAAAMVYLR